MSGLRFTYLGDQAVLAYFSDEQDALRFSRRIRSAHLSWVVDVVVSYRSVAVFYDLEAVGYDEAVEALTALPEVDSGAGNFASQLHVIPCCYELGSDFALIEKHTGLTRRQIIELHSTSDFTVYALGFCPGFPYLGYLPETLCGVPRLGTPRLKVEAGSVGLTGRQTGIYTQEKPGGWNIVGRTPLELVNVADEYFPIRVGDEVRFREIDNDEFKRLQGKCLSDLQ